MQSLELLSAASKSVFLAQEKKKFQGWAFKGWAEAAKVSEANSLATSIFKRF
jgi:hypothetical protein